MGQILEPICSSSTLYKPPPLLQNALKSLKKLNIFGWPSDKLAVPGGGEGDTGDGGGRDRAQPREGESGGLLRGHPTHRYVTNFVFGIFGHVVRAGARRGTYNFPGQVARRAGT
eukprot:738480-Prorocentrum_minimum.AAC.2